MQSLENIMLITDLDGTLLPSSKEISAADAAAISQFRAKGGKFAIATGRTLQAAQRYLNKLKPNIPVILFNGAAIYDPVTEKWLYTEKLPADAVAVTRQVLDAFMDGKSYQEIADMLGRHVKSIDNALQRVKRKLVKFMEENK